MEPLIEKQLESSSLFSSKMLEKQLKEYKNELINISTTEALSDLIENDFSELCTYYVAIGSKEYDKVTENIDLDVNEVFLLHYTFSESFKDIMLLHRDVFLQLQIAKHKYAEEVVSENALFEHFKKSKELLLQATQYFCEKASIERDTVYETGKKVTKTYSKFKHKTNPWELYKEQFLLIITQLQEIRKSEKPFSKTINSFKNIRSYNSTICEAIINDAEYIKKSAGQVIESLKKVDTIAHISDSIHLIDSFISKTSDTNQDQEKYPDEIDIKLKPLQELIIPVATDEGYVLTKKIDFNKTTQKWLDYELLPKLIDLWDNRANMASYFKHSLLNLKSSLVLVKNNSNLEIIPAQLQMFKNVHYTLSSNTSKQKELAAEFTKKITLEFLATPIYGNKNFLEVSLQSSLTQLTTSNNTIFVGLRNKLKKLLSDFNTKYEKRVVQSTHRKLELSSECISYRMYKESNAHYDTLFLNRNFIGNLFIAPREFEEKKLQSTLAQWKDGFNKAVLVTGNNLSGKSTFLQYATKKHYGKLVIFLEPESEIVIEGRKFSTTKNLKEALQEIKKNIYSIDPIIVIDDIELWRDKKHSLLDNVRAVLQFIESESDEAFVMVSTSREMQKHLDKRLAFSNTFSTVIDINKTKIEEIYKALLSRHGASHKSLVTEEGAAMTKKEIEKRVLSLCKKFDYNIGEVLQGWTYGTTVLDNNNVVYIEKEYPFEDFFTPEETIILKYVLLYKNINELQLKNFLGKRFESGYKSGLKRLINTKVLVRNSMGVLKINTVLGHDIYEILKYKGTLK
ncbi:hypothetical protein [Aquimarina latercula]|uniref:hypothetical protein n=1 Tax=Aquimarina latercula TaxID=987 RepID=UPI00040EB8E6|nr:hypothetical protein [Aquimarina latercula]